MNPQRVTFPLFDVASCPTIPLTALKSRRWDLFEGKLCPVCNCRWRDLDKHTPEECLLAQIHES